MGIVRQGPPEAIVLGLAHQHGVNSFVETGTFLGSTARWAAEHFARVITIERVEVLYERARATHAHNTNITFLLGDTRTQLTTLLPSLDRPALFWLDAHWSGGATYGEADECPLLEELAIINHSPLAHLVLIDDARLFLAPPPPPHHAEQWPDLRSVLAALGSERYVIVIDDVIIAVPLALRPALIRLGQAAAQQAWQEQLAQRSPPRTNTLRRLAGWLRTRVGALPGRRQ